MSNALANLTYMVRHNPNCPKRFEVRLSGMALLISMGCGPKMIDDDVGYGDTFEEAAANALAVKSERAWRPKFREIWEGL